MSYAPCLDEAISAASRQVTANTDSCGGVSLPGRIARRHRRRNIRSPAAKVQALRGARLRALLALDFCLGYLPAFPEK